MRRRQKSGTTVSEKQDKNKKGEDSLRGGAARVHCQIVNAGVVTLGEGLRLVAAQSPIDPELHRIKLYEFNYDVMLRQ